MVRPEVLDRLQDEVIADVDRREARGYVARTPRELARFVRVLVQRLDPRGQAQLHREAVERDTGVWVEQLGDALAKITAVGPAIDSHTILTALDLLAAKQTERTGRQAARFQALLGLAAAAIEDPDAPRPHRAPIRVCVVVDLATALGCADNPAVIPGSTRCPDRWHVS